MTPKHIPNGDLRLEKLPGKDADWETIQRFALTFDGYSYWGRSIVAQKSQSRDDGRP